MALGKVKKKSFRGLVSSKSKREKKKAKEEEKSTPVIKEEKTTETTPAKSTSSETKPTKTKPVAVETKPAETKPAETKPAEAKPAKAETKPAATKSVDTATKAVDDETVYTADFDAQSKATTTVEGSDKAANSSLPPIADPLAIVLLLMDPITRRFELLQLEFDTKNATVADIIQQIPISATEESLRTQTFDCVCDADGNEYDHDKPLSDYVDGNAVVISVPRTNTKGAMHAAKMAKPILRDPKVEEMLKSAGVNLPPPPAQDEAVKEVKEVDTNPNTPRAVPPLETPSSIPEESVKPAEVTKSSNFTSYLIIGAVAAYMARVLLHFQTEITKPLGVGSTLAPGAWRSRCGFIQTDCKPGYIEMGMDGNLHIVENEGVTFSLLGNVCDEGDESCVPGAEISEDGTLKIGGAPVKVGLKSKYPLNPWPFDEGIGPVKGRKAWF